MTQATPQVPQEGAEINDTNRKALNVLATFGFDEHSVEAEIATAGNGCVRLVDRKYFIRMNDRIGIYTMYETPGLEHLN